MSLARIIAAMASRRDATFIGFTSDGEASTSIAPANLPSGTQVGDYMLIIYYSGRTLSGGGGAMTTISFTDTKISHRQVLAGDLTTSFTFDLNTPYIVGVWRGPTRMSAALSSYSGAPGGPTFLLPGVTKPADCMAIIGVGTCSNSPVYFNPPPYSIWNNAKTQGTSGIGYGAGSITNTDGYADGSDFQTFLDTSDGTANAKTYALLT